MATDVVQVANPTLPPAGGASPDPKAPGGASTAASTKAPGSSASSSSESTTASPSSRASSEPAGKKAGGAASGTPDGSSSASEQKPEGDAKPEQKVRTAAVILAEREAKLTEDRRAHKTETERLANERKAHEAEVAFAKRVLEAAKGKSRLAVIDLAAENAGVTREQFLEALQDEYLGGLKEPTVDERVARTVEEKLAAERKKAEDDAKAKADDDLKKQQAAGEAAYNGYCEAVQALAAELGPKFAEDFDLCNTFNVTPRRVADKALEMWKASNGKTPTPREALEALEADLAATVAKSKKFRAAEAPKTEEKQDETARDSTPRTLTPTSRSVPISAKPTAVKKKTALERLAEARRDLGDAGN